MHISKCFMLTHISIPNTMPCHFKADLPNYWTTLQKKLFFMALSSVKFSQLPLKQDVKKKWFSERSKSRSKGTDIERSHILDVTGTNSDSNSSTESIATAEGSGYNAQSRLGEGSMSSPRMFSPVYYRRSVERTYYSPSYRPWSRDTSWEREYSKSSDESIYSEQCESGSVSNCRRAGIKAHVSLFAHN